MSIASLSSGLQICSSFSPCGLGTNRGFILPKSRDPRSGPHTEWAGSPRDPFLTHTSLLYDCRSSFFSLTIHPRHITHTRTHVVLCQVGRHPHGPPETWHGPAKPHPRHARTRRAQSISSSRRKRTLIIIIILSFSNASSSVRITIAQPKEASRYQERRRGPRQPGQASMSQQGLSKAQCCRRNLSNLWSCRGRQQHCRRGPVRRDLVWRGYGSGFLCRCRPGRSPKHGPFVSTHRWHRG